MVSLVPQHTVGVEGGGEMRMMIENEQQMTWNYVNFE